MKQNVVNSFGGTVAWFTVDWTFAYVSEHGSTGMGFGGFKTDNQNTFLVTNSWATYGDSAGFSGGYVSPSGSALDATEVAHFTSPFNSLTTNMYNNVVAENAYQVEVYANTYGGIAYQSFYLPIAVSFDF